MEKETKTFNGKTINLVIVMKKENTTKTMTMYPKSTEKLDTTQFKCN